MDYPKFIDSNQKKDAISKQMLKDSSRQPVTDQRYGYFGGNDSHQNSHIARIRYRFTILYKYAVMTHGDPKGQLHTNNDFFIAHNLIPHSCFRISSQKFMKTLGNTFT